MSELEISQQKSKSFQHLELMKKRGRVRCCTCNYIKPRRRYKYDLKGVCQHPLKRSKEVAMFYWRKCKLYSSLVITDHSQLSENLGDSQSDSAPNSKEKRR